jgi:predicted membrane protein DUF2142
LVTPFGINSLLPRVLPWLIAFGWALLLLAWVMGDAPFAAPDEEGHYSRAIGISEGALIGAEAPPPGDIDTPRGKWAYQTTTVVKIPSNKVPPTPGCFTLDVNASAACVEGVPTPPQDVETRVYVGTYEPLPYLLPAVAVRLADDPLSALRLARLAGALPALLLLMAAIFVLRDPDNDPLALLGPLLAVTPMAIFVASSLTGSGLEVASGIAFVASLLRIARGTPTRFVWLAAGVSGSTLALSRSGSPAWILLAAALFVALLGPRAAWSAVRAGGRAAAASLAGIATAVVLNRIWEAAHGYNDLPIGFEGKRHGLQESWTVLGNMADQLIGKFGYLEFGLPLTAVRAWFGAVAVVALVALLVARWRHRVVLIAAIVGAIAVPMVFWFALMRHTGFGIQGRHVLPILVVVPLLAGELVYRNRSRIRRPIAGALLFGVPLMAGAVQAVAWHRMAQRYAVGLDGPVNFLGSAEWAPPLGWGPWLALALIGSLLLATGSLCAIRPRPRRAGAPC